jgi:hypothetical protein
MGEHAARYPAEQVHLLQEVVAHVVADSLEVDPPRVRDHLDVRTPDDQAAAVGHDGLELVHHLARHPHLVVHLGRPAEHGAERAGLVHDVDPGGEVGCGLPCLLGGAGPQAGQLARPVDDHGEAMAGHRDQGRGPVHHRPHGRVLEPDRTAAGDDRAEPVEEVHEVAARDAREEVLVAPREPHDLVGEHGTEDQQQVVVVDGPVDHHVDVLAEEAIGDRSHAGCGERADLLQGVGTVPPVVHEPAPGEGAFPVRRREAEESEQLLVAQRLVRAQRHHEVERFRARSDMVVDQARHQGQRGGPRGVRGQDEDALAFHQGCGDSLLDNPPGLLLGESRRRIALSNRHERPPAPAGAWFKLQ